MPAAPALRRVQMRETRPEPAPPAGDQAREDHLAMALAALRAHVQAMCRTSEPFWATCDLTIVQLKALIQIETTGTRTVGLLARALVMSNPSASVLVEQL